MTNNEALRRARGLRTTSLGLAFAIVFGVALIAFRSLAAFFVGGFVHQTWSVSGDVILCLMWASAWFSAAFLFGFLFGIPKAPRTRAGDSDQAASDPSSAGDDGATRAPYQLRANTNLEEISDWLTKVLVGATLTQVGNVPSRIGAAARYMASDLEGTGHEAFTASILVYFSSLGFVSGYTLTRMFFSEAFALSDLSSVIPTLEDAEPGLDPQPLPNDVALHEAAEKTRGINITKSLSADVALVAATGALLMGDNRRAVRAAKIAVEKNPSDPRSHFNYATALHRMGLAPDLVESELKRARELVNQSPDPLLREGIYNSIVFFYLYKPPPEGFTKAIESGEEYISHNRPMKRSILINVACAYAQKYSYLLSQSASSAELSAVRANALDVIRRALDMDPRALERLRQLATGVPNPEDNDLKVFASDAEVKELLGL